MSQTVREINWEKGKVSVFTTDCEFSADAIILTASVGNLQKRQIRFIPEIDTFSGLFHHIGFGSVIKILLEFDRAFWEDKFPDLGFLFTDGGFTFWTQLEMHKPLLTGRIGDHHSKSYRKTTDEKLLEIALRRLSDAFATDATSGYKAGVVFRYDTDAASSGGYSYLTPESQKAIRKINCGVESTIYFAGEALHSRGEVATVEAALQSGRYVARKIIKSLK